LQQPVVERTGGVDLALQNVVLDAALLQVEHLIPEVFDLFPHRQLLALRRLECGLERGPDRFDLVRELPIDLLDFGADFDHRRKGRLEGLELLLVFGCQHVAAGAQAIDHAVRQQLRHVDGAGLGDLLPQLLIPDPLRDDLTERGVGAGQIGLGDGGFLGHEDDLLALCEIEQRLFGLLQAQLHLLDLVLEEGLGVGIGLESLIEIGGDVGVGVGVGDPLRAPGIRVGVRDIDQARSRHRPHAIVAENDACSPPLHRRLVHRLLAFGCRLEEALNRAQN